MAIDSLEAIQAGDTMQWCRTPGLPLIRVGASHRPGRRYRPGVAADRRVLRLRCRRQHPRRGGNFTRSQGGALSPAAAFGADFVLTIPGTTRIDTIPAGPPEQVRL